MIIIIGRCEVSVEPDGSTFGFSHFCAAGGCEEGGGEAKEVGAIFFATKLYAVDDVTPLIAAAHLKNSSVAAVQFGKVVALEDHVIKFNECHWKFSVKARFNTVKGEHAVDGEVHTDVAQEFNVI